ncbi:sensor domain-containing diguanylate cyclase [Trinickia mobilis]|uniref:sensor domain-containing diguanylate cyclase n=1 Tax=Trinickia mobilis TaxID=2816356 RepID=UPI001A8F9FE8|nr:sensor domain-containing diguanylate cyclase [Trinickia mobilis]
MLILTRRPALIVALSVALAGTVLAICVSVLIQMRQDAAQRAQDAATNLLLLVERDTARNLEIYALSLQAVIDGLRQPGLDKLPPAIRQAVLFDGSAMATHLGSILVVDAQGNVIYDSRAEPPRKLNVADRDYFRVQRDTPDAGLYVSHPFIPRLSGKSPSIALSRRLSNPDGSFAGVVAGTLRLDYFHSLFDGMKLGPHGSMALMLADGTMLMRRPYDPNIIGRSLLNTSNYTRFTQAPSGSFYGTAAIDGVERWYAFSHVARFPLIYDVALSTDDMYANWRRRAWVFGTIVAVLDVLIIWFAMLFSQQMRRRTAVEAELRMLARTDGLTSLGNRRALDEVGAKEWRLARRGGQPLSVLLIDVDHFKGFNDLYGHAAGDDALTAVAHCIKNGLRRPADHAARYGGEEFVVLLPATDIAGARLVAESMRESVQSLGMRHVASTHQVLTVSIGVASTEARRFADLRALIDAADAALYAAKAEGRNRTMLDGAAECGAADREPAPAASPAKSDANPS